MSFVPMGSLTSAQVAYDLYAPGEVDADLWARICAHRGISPDRPVMLLPHGKSTLPSGEKVDRVLWETRKLYFFLAVSGDGRMRQEPRISRLEDLSGGLPTTRIISFGTCNVACPYCKRDCQFLGDDGNPIVAIAVPLHQILGGCVGAHLRGEIVRYSGGDPVMFPRETLAIAEYMMTRHGVKVSIAHNGSGTSWAAELAPYLSSAAIDLKATPERIGEVMGIDPSKGPRMYQRSLDTQGQLSHAGVLVDVRTPVFGDTSTDDMRRLAHDICSVNDLSSTFWTWRLYKAVQGCDWLVSNKERVIEQMLVVSSDFPELWFGIRAKWQRGGMEYIRAGRLIDASDDTEAVYDPEVGSGNEVILSPA